MAASRQEETSKALAAFLYGHPIANISQPSTTTPMAEPPPRPASEPTIPAEKLVEIRSFDLPPALEGEFRDLWPIHADVNVAPEEVPAWLRDHLSKPTNIAEVLKNQQILSTHLQSEPLNAAIDKLGRSKYTIQANPVDFFMSYRNDAQFFERLERVPYPDPLGQVFDLSKNRYLDDEVDHALAYGAYNNPLNHILGPGQYLSLSTLNPSTDGGFYARGYFHLNPSAAWPMDLDPTVSENEPRFLADNTLPRGQTLHLGALLFPTLRHYNATHRRHPIPHSNGSDPAIINLPETVSPTYYAGWAALKRKQFLPYFLRFWNIVEAEMWCPPLLLVRREGIDLESGEPAMFLQGEGTRYGLEEGRLCGREEEQGGKLWVTFEKGEGEEEKGEEGMGKMRIVVGRGL